MSPKKQAHPQPTREEALEAIIRGLSAHPCCHPPSCGHARYSECRSALATAIADAVRRMP
jgi:hypothetical protein